MQRRTLLQMALAYSGTSVLYPAMLQDKSKTAWSVRMADSDIKRNPEAWMLDFAKKPFWGYCQGLVCLSLKKLWEEKGDSKYYEYVKKYADDLILADGTITTYDKEKYNIDAVNSGKILFAIYEKTKEAKYKKALDTLRDQMRSHPRTTEGGFWHKQRYPNQMWLDGIYMLEPFYAEYGSIFNQNNWDDIVQQFQLCYKGTLDAKTGLLYHAYDAAKVQPWADKQSGKSPNFWGRSIGWYLMALVDVLDYMPTNHPKRGILVKQLNDLSNAVAKVQDAKSGLWYQVPNFPGRKGNYLEASCANMFVYAFAKGVRKGYLPSIYLQKAQNAYRGILKEFITKDDKGYLHLEKTVTVGGLGGTPYRDGSYEYYLSEPLRTDDLKGAGPFILASLEIEVAKELPLGKGKKVVMDYFFNREFRKTKEGKSERFHYTWEDRKDSGMHLWGIQFEQLGATLDSLPVAPTLQNLKGADVYILVDPDTPKETANPNYIQPKDVQNIVQWVKNGGHLIVLANDTTNCEITHLNTLMKEFGIEFGGPNRNMVQGKNWHQGAVAIPANHDIFSDMKKIYIKEISTLYLSKTAKSSVNHEGVSVIATANVGKGKVFAVGDPWLYNEYTNNRRIPLDYENFQAAKKLAEWSLK